MPRTRSSASNAAFSKVAEPNLTFGSAFADFANFATASVLLVPPLHTLVIPPMHWSCYLSTLLVKVFTCRNEQQAITHALEGKFQASTIPLGAIRRLDREVLCHYSCNRTASAPPFRSSRDSVKWRTHVSDSYQPPYSAP
ncbi:hypothetical protein K503DRAFT_776846 [Rhizopogon vinicolor AM-OR11-026]|uniref:Uncharacterized protein n=1 Tax=Rhizopogon vinicolor AM-OR11-026 TaxID=1314800 RepID=A0A1B7MI30_9AGAM|nr:hypothetical protein K503DRAFT_776846 [Rhizopogon vinicolor AM-OR11-026]